MKNLLFLLLVISILLFGCTDTSKPSVSPTPKPTKKSLVEIPSGTPTPIASPTPTPKPIIITAGPNVLIANMSAFINWTTNFKSNAVLEWGKDEKYGFSRAIIENTTTHRMNISGLNYLESIHFRVISCSGDNCVKSADNNFTMGHRPCAQGMVYVSDGDFCIDSFEATVRNGIAISQGGTVPQNLISYAESKKACELAGKRLCTSKEFTSACNINGEKYGEIGNDECNVRNGTYILAGIAQKCYSREGVHDLIGNFWEWVSDITTENTPRADGLVDREDILIAGKNYVLPRQPNSKTTNLGNDYYFNREVNPLLFVGKGIVRGGYYKSEKLGGCFAYQVGIPLDGADSISFRCCS